MRVSGYRLMWLMVMFDLPVLTRENRRNYRRFVDWLEDDGYFRLQFSVYGRPCATEENLAAHLNDITAELPPEGEVRILRFTDKQWGRMMLFRAARCVATEEAPAQLTIFDAPESDGPPPPREPRKPKPPPEPPPEPPPPPQPPLDIF